MITHHQEHLVSLLLASFPNFQSGDSDAALAAYALVLERADHRDIEPGIMMLINGDLPGFDGRFAPTATQLSRAIRVCLEKRVDAEIAERRRLPPPHVDEPEPTPEQKARVQALMAKVKRDYGSDREDEDRQAQRLAMLRKTNERFDREGTAHTTFNSADDDQFDMGQARAS